MSPPKPQEPYIGLRPFESHESHLFFGRAEQVESMLQRMESSRFLAVIGASGCGKSSLVRAGLLPAVANGFVMNEPEQWQFVTIKPGDNPFHSLAEGLLGKQTGGQLLSSTGCDPALDPNQVQTLERVLRTGRRSLIEVMLSWQEKQPLLLLVDQFEELFRFRQEAHRTESSGSFRLRDDALAFVDLLLATIDPGSTVASSPAMPTGDAKRDTPTDRDAARIYVVITMRSDFMGHCEAFTGLPEKISECQFLAPRMDRHQLQEAIVEPLRVLTEMARLASGNETGSVAWKSAVPSPAFVNRVLNDVGTDPDMLPLMQHALKRTWQQAVLRCGADAPVELTVVDYEEVGGFDNALNRHATEIYQSLDGVKHDTAGSRQHPEKSRPGEGSESRLQLVSRRLFCCLSDRREDGPLVRRPRTIDEISPRSRLRERLTSPGPRSCR